MAYVPPHRRRPQANNGSGNERTAQHRRLGNAQGSDRNSSDKESLAVLENAFDRICCINLDTRIDKWKLIQRDAEKVGESFRLKIERVSAVEGNKTRDSNDNDVCFEWDGTTDARYNRHGRPGPRLMTPSEAGCALSHVKLWKELASMHDAAIHTGNSSTMLILEDDVRFSTVRGQSRFAKAFAEAWNLLPEDWGFLYLGLSSRGERTWLHESSENAENCGDTKAALPDKISNPPVRLYKPEYGYHTHAYAIRRETAQILVQNLPIAGPIDVWLADNQWFSQPVYCAVIANEGWRLDDGTYEGSDLVRQERRSITNDIEHCS